jgi:hypothetical protein
VSLFGGPVETRHHQVQIHRQRVHVDDLARRGRTKQIKRLLCAVSGHVLPRGQRRVFEGSEVTVDANGCPCLELRVEVRPHALRLGAERVANEVDGGCVIGVAIGLSETIFLDAGVAIGDFP